jgi:hypothetical protein
MKRSAKMRTGLERQGRPSLVRRAGRCRSPVPAREGACVTLDLTDQRARFSMRIGMILGTAAALNARPGQVAGGSFDQNIDDFHRLHLAWTWSAAATTFFNTLHPVLDMTEDDAVTRIGDYACQSGASIMWYLD